MTKIKLIEKGQSREVNTKFGLRTIDSWKILVDGESVPKWASVFSNPTIASWDAEETIFIDTLEESEFKGKVQYTIKMPKVDNRGYSKTSTPAPSVHGDLMAKIDQLDANIKKMSTLVDRVVQILEEKPF